MSRITPRPRTRYRLPRYPTRLQVNEHPALLARHLPPAWAARKELAGAAALLVSAAIATGSSGKPERSDGEKRNLPIMVAPVFHHGYGSWSTGCMVVASPVFLSEEEAREIIIDELAADGIIIDKQDVEIESVKIDVCHDTCTAGKKTWNVEFCFPCNGKYKNEDGSEVDEVFTSQLTTETFKADGVDTKKKVAFEYVSRDDYEDLKMLTGFDCSNPNFGGTAYSYPLAFIATNLASKISLSKPQYYFGTFYDPISYREVQTINISKECAYEISGHVKKPSPECEKAFNEEMERIKKENKINDQKSLVDSRRLLRLQVRDFANWLKAQGAI